MNASSWILGLIESADMRRLLVTTREAWRAWLAEHHVSESEIWLVYHKQASGKPRIPYEDAVEEAHCFGRIDSVVRRLDKHRFAQKFTPRRALSQWSDLNRARFAKVVKEGRMTAAGLARSPSTATSNARERPRRPEITAPGYLVRALKRHPAARTHFESLAPSHQRAYSMWIETAKKAETRQRRLAEALELLARKQKLGLK